MVSFSRQVLTYRSTSNRKLNLAPVRTHEHTKLVDDALERTQPVVLSKRSKQILDDSVLVSATQVLLELLHNLLLVGGR